MTIYLYLRHFPERGTPLMGGTAKAVHGLAAGLAACGGAVTVLCEGTVDACTTSPAGYTIRSFDAASHTALRPSPGLQTFICDEMEPGLVVLNGMFHPTLPGLGQVLTREHIPYIVAPHRPYSSFIFGRHPLRKWSYWLLRERALLRQARAIQVLAPYHARLLRSLKVDTPTIVIPNGFALEEITLPQQPTTAPTRMIRLFFFGRIDAHDKGLDLLLAAFARLNRTRSATLTLQGPEAGGRHLLTRQAEQLGVADRITFLAPDYETPPPSLMAQYDIFCLPSRCEGMSMSSIEAMLAGRVLMVSEVDGIAPHVRRSGCGVVVAPEPTAVWDGLRRLIERRPFWHMMGQQGHDYALKHLAWTPIAQQALEEYAALDRWPVASA